jgi:steroid delta-isomerase-like uncharacterized protein
MEENKAIVLRFFEEAFNRGNLAVIDELIAPHLAYHSPDGDIRGLEGTYQLVTGMRTAVPDFHVTVEEVIAEGEKVVIRYADRGTHQGEGIGVPPTGKHATWVGVDIFRIADGKIIEGWGVYDSLGLMQQLGVIPKLLRPEEPGRWVTLACGGLSRCRSAKPTIGRSNPSEGTRARPGAARLPGGSNPPPP